MKTENISNLQIFLNILAPVITVTGILVGVWTFIEGEKNKTRLEYELIAQQSAVDFQRTLWREQLETYKEISKLAGKIVSHNGSDSKFKELINEFRGMYWGSMILIEDESVETEMVHFNLEIEDFLGGKSTEKKLKTRAKMLISACRKSSEREWKKITESVGSNQ